MGSPHPTPESRPTTAAHPEKPYACGGCTTRWSGISRCHCSRCHQTFGGIELFDRHQHLRNSNVGYCDDPATMTNLVGERVMFLNEFGVWTSAENPTRPIPPRRARA